VYLSGEETASFLRTLADALEDDSEVTIHGNDWEILLKCAELIEVEMEILNRSGREVEFEELEDSGRLSAE
jgi:amphi-Trp domain-containing protein